MKQYVIQDKNGYYFGKTFANDGMVNHMEWTSNIEDAYVYNKLKDAKEMCLTFNTVVIDKKKRSNYMEEKVMQVLDGPMAQRKENDDYVSIFKKDGAHYNIYSIKSGMRALRDLFEDGDGDFGPNEMNFVLFGTSGVHGTYTTIEEIEQQLIARREGNKIFDDDGDEIDTNEVLGLTVLIIQPRLVCMRYGHIDDLTLEDIPFLKMLREKSWEVIMKIGRHK